MRLFLVVVLQVQGALPRSASGIHHVGSVTSLIGARLSQLCKERHVADVGSRNVKSPCPRSWLAVRHGKTFGPGECFSA